MTKLIGFTGRLQAGKDTAWLGVEQWAKDNGRSAVRQGFADKLKISAAKALGLGGTDEELIDKMNRLKSGGEVSLLIDDNNIGFTITGRQYLQLYGTEAHREVFNDNFWVDALLPTGFKTIDHSPGKLVNVDIWPDNFDDADFAVVTDVRFPNEGERIHELHGELIEIIRPSLGENKDNHASEAGVGKEYITHRIYNDGSIADLHNTINTWLNEKYHG